MKIQNPDYSKSVVLINTLARALQNASAKPDNHNRVYEITNDIMIECEAISRQITLNQSK